MCWATFCLMYWGSAANQMAAGWRPSVFRDKIWAILRCLYNAGKCSSEGNDSNLCVQLRTLSCSPQSLKLTVWLYWDYYMKSCISASASSFSLLEAIHFIGLNPDPNGTGTHQHLIHYFYSWQRTACGMWGNQHLSCTADNQWDQPSLYPEIS